MVTDTSKSLRFQKTQMFSQTIDQKEHKNNRYKLEPATWCYKHHSNGHTPTHYHQVQTVTHGSAYCIQPWLPFLIITHLYDVEMEKFSFPKSSTVTNNFPKSNSEYTQFITVQFEQFSSLPGPDTDDERGYFV